MSEKNALLEDILSLFMGFKPVESQVELTRRLLRLDKKYPGIIERYEGRVRRSGPSLADEIVKSAAIRDARHEKSREVVRKVISEGAKYQERLERVDELSAESFAGVLRGVSKSIKKQYSTIDLIDMFLRETSDLSDESYKEVQERLDDMRGSVDMKTNQRLQGHRKRLEKKVGGVFNDLLNNYSSDDLLVMLQNNDLGLEDEQYEQFKKQVDNINTSVFSQRQQTLQAYHEKLEDILGGAKEMFNRENLVRASTFSHIYNPQTPQELEGVLAFATNRDHVPFLKQYPALNSGFFTLKRINDYDGENLEYIGIRNIVEYET